MKIHLVKIMQLIIGEQVEEFAVVTIILQHLKTPPSQMISHQYQFSTLPAFMLVTLIAIILTRGTMTSIHTEGV